VPYERAGYQHGFSTGFPRVRLFPSGVARIAPDGAGAVSGCRHEVAVDMAGDLGALAPEPTGHLGDRDAVGHEPRRWRGESAEGTAQVYLPPDLPLPDGEAEWPGHREGDARTAARATRHRRRASHQTAPLSPRHGAVRRGMPAECPRPADTGPAPVVIAALSPPRKPRRARSATASIPPDGSSVARQQWDFRMC